MSLTVKISYFLRCSRTSSTLAPPVAWLPKPGRLQVLSVMSVKTQAPGSTMGPGHHVPADRQHTLPHRSLKNTVGYKINQHRVIFLFI